MARKSHSFTSNAEHFRQKRSISFVHLRVIRSNDYQRDGSSYELNATHVVRVFRAAAPMYDYRENKTP